MIKNSKLVLWLCITKIRQMTKKLCLNATLWLGYNVRNTIACKNGKSLESTLSISKLIKIRMTHNEALEHLAVNHFFLYIP